MNKKHILLIENNENEVEFFTDALEESKLNFLCSTARNTEQAVRILKNIVPDIVFLDAHIADKSGEFLKKILGLQKVPVIKYSSILNYTQDNSKNENSSYLQLPGNVRTMASILQSLLL